jgi:signal transduction histidine kinase
VIRRSVANNDPNALHHVDVARTLVRFSHREARKSLTPVTGPAFSNTDLLSSLKACAQGLADTGGIEIEAQCSNVVRPLPTAVSEQLFHIGQEAIANAIRHASPTRVAVAIDYGLDCVQMKIVDNGGGFTMRGDLLGFGIRGMRKRASEISAELDISSALGAGTCVSITVPVVRRSSLRSYAVAGLDFAGKILETKLYGRNRRAPNSHSDR